MVRWSHYYESRREEFSSKMKYPILEGRNILFSLLRIKNAKNYFSLSVWQFRLIMSMFFFLPTSSKKKSTQRFKWMSHFWKETLHIYFSQQQWLNILPHSGFYYYSAFTPYWNLRYNAIQEHVSLLSNYCAVFVVHFWSVFDITSMPWHNDLI